MPVNSQAAEYAEMLPKWTRCRDVRCGEAKVHAGGEKYLPKLKAQDAKEYQSYVMRSSFYNATWRTIAGLVGMMFRKPPVVEVPPDVEELLKNVDGEGSPFHLLLQDVAENALVVGRVGALVDYPVVQEGLTVADAALQNARPTIKLYQAEKIINWRVASVNNETKLVMVVLEECEYVAKDEFSGADEKRWRVLDLSDLGYRQRLFKLKGKSLETQKNLSFEQVGPDIFPKMYADKPMDFIPFTIMGTDDVGVDVDEPPLIDLVDTNLAHYRVNADYEHGCHFTAMPTLFLSGFKSDVDANGNPAKVYVGGETAIVTSNPDAKGSFIEFTGQGLGVLENNLARKEKQMAVLGARMLEEQQKAVESGEAASIHRSGEQATLASVSIAISLGMTQVVKWFTEWAGLDPSAVSVEINREFYATKLDSAMLTALISGWQQGVPGLSDQSVFDNLKAGGLVADDVTLEDEQARIAERQQEMLEQSLAMEAASTPSPIAPSTDQQGSAQPIVIQLAKGSGKRTVTGPNGQKYTIEEAA